MGRTHAVSGAAVWLTGCAAATAVGVDVEVLPAAIGAALSAAGALLPDIDKPGSKASRQLGAISWGIAYITADASAWIHARTATRYDKPCRDGHRAVTHTLLFAVVVGALLCGMVAAVAPAWWWLGIPLAIGCLTHDLGDAANPSGCPILWPLRIDGRRWYRVRWPWLLQLNGRGEQWIVGPSCVAAAIASAWAIVL